MHVERKTKSHFARYSFRSRNPNDDPPRRAQLRHRLPRADVLQLGLRTRERNLLEASPRLAPHRLRQGFHKLATRHVKPAADHHRERFNRRHQGGEEGIVQRYISFFVVAKGDVGEGGKRGEDGAEARDGIFECEGDEGRGRGCEEGMVQVAEVAYGPRVSFRRWNEGCRLAGMASVNLAFMMSVVRSRSDG